MKYKGIIFDLDGTLVNSLEDLADAMNAVLQDLHFPTHSYQDYELFIGNGLKNLVIKALPENQKTESQIKHCYDLMIAIYSEACANKTKPYDGIVELLDHLVSKNIQLGVFSNKSDELTKKVVGTLFPNYFETIIGLTTEALKKPNPTKALEIAASMGYKPEEMLFIGDSDVDMQTATNATMPAVGVLWGYRSKEDLLSNGAKFILNHPSDLLAIL
jgi:phosphoglycolate phosphatase